MLSREKKEKQVEQLTRILAENGAVIFTDFSGLATPEMSALRNKLREEGVRYKVTKKSLWPFVQQKAAEYLPTEAEDQLAFADHKGSVGIAYSEGEGIEASKVITEFAKEYKSLTVLGGLVQGELLGLERIKALAALPSREELLAQVVYVLNAPMRNLVGVLRGPQRELVQVLSQIQKSK